MEIKQNLLPINRFSRPGTLLKDICGIVLHWVGNPKSTALGNRNYFENLKLQPYETEEDVKKARFASAHFIIGLQGEIIQCLPENEMAYHVGAKEYKPDVGKYLGAYPNNSTIGIELCHEDWTGNFSLQTINNALMLTIQLLYRYKLTAKNVYRHFDITGKDCPHYFVKNEEAWINFIDAVTAFQKNLKTS
jgi:N-acetylmuramoyl-L-alanine amidase